MIVYELHYECGGYNTIGTASYEEKQTQEDMVRFGETVAKEKGWTLVAIKERTTSVIYTKTS